MGGRTVNFPCKQRSHWSKGWVSDVTRWNKPIALSDRGCFHWDAEALSLDKVVFIMWSVLRFKWKRNDFPWIKLFRVKIFDSTQRLWRRERSGASLKPLWWSAWGRHWVGRCKPRQRVQFCCCVCHVLIGLSLGSQPKRRICVFSEFPEVCEVLTIWTDSVTKFGAPWSVNTPTQSYFTWPKQCRTGFEKFQTSISSFLNARTQFASVHGDDLKWNSA